MTDARSAEYGPASDSLRRRMAALHSIYDHAVDSMDLGHVNHEARPGVLPIAFSLFHVAQLTDTMLEVMTGRPPLWDDAWDAAIRPAIPDYGKEKSVAEMGHQRIGDLDAFRRYQRAVFARFSEWLDEVDPSGLGRIVVERPCRRPWPRRSAHASPVRTASPCSTRPRAGSTSTGSVTWARSDTADGSSACKA